MVIANFQGRLGNNLIQFFAAYFFSRKHNLDFFMNHQNVFSVNGNKDLENIIISHQGQYDINNKDTIIINDDNFLEYYESDVLPDVNFSFIGYFQFRAFLLPLKNDIKNILKISYQDVDKDKVFIHYRLGDIKDSKLMLPLEYYIDALNVMGNPTGYISSDTIEHENCQFLIKNYKLSVIEKNPWSTILFAKDFDKLILSEGTFSVMIGFLSNATKIITNMRNTEWGGGDLCSGFENYIRLQYNYKPYPNVIKID